MVARLLFAFLLIFLVGSHEAFASVEETCAQATEGHENKHLDSFCVTTLQAAPGSTSADVRGLAVIAANLTLANYTAAVTTIKKLQRHGGWSNPQRAALALCRQRYIEGLAMVHRAVDVLATGRKHTYLQDMDVVKSSATGCAYAFDEDAIGLRKVNDDAEKLATMAMLIVIML